jgi:hypothetical protein
MLDETRDHLFISYATEDVAAAEWLSLKLASEGFRVWCDRYQLLGGESYPKDIDEAIKTRTFRLLALISRHSLQKPNPLKERTLALKLAAARKEEFLIPLNLDNTNATDITWDITDITFIPFTSWATGLNQLLAKLAKIRAPRTFVATGREAATAALQAIPVIMKTTEPIYTNRYPFSRLPDLLHIGQRNHVSDSIPFFPLADNRTASFLSGPAPQPGDETIAWRRERQISNVPTTDIITSLLRQTVANHLLASGLHVDVNTQTLYFPIGLLPKNRLTYRRGRKRHYIDATSLRHHRSLTYRYHLAPAFTITKTGRTEFAADLRVTLYLTDQTGTPLSKRDVIACRKQLGGSWWDHEWYNRQRGIMHFITRGHPDVNVGTQDVLISMRGRPMTADAPRSIDERALEAYDKQHSQSHVADYQR